MPTRSLTLLQSALIAVAACFLALKANSAPSGGEFEFRNSTIDGGGGESSGGAFVLRGTIGQPDASDAHTGGDFTLRGGFWADGQPGISLDLIFLDDFE